MSDGRPGLWARLFRRGADAAPLRAGQNLPVSAPTLGLSFVYERGVAYDSEYLSDIGLEHILKTLRTHGLRATFSCPAKLCEIHPERVKMIEAAGHEIAALGYADEVLPELTDDGIRQLVYTCRNAFIKIGLRPLGFSAPRSQWDERLCAELARQHFRYNAEHDHAKDPYVIAGGPPPLVRIPLSTDDRGLLRSEQTVDRTISKHHRRLRQAIDHRHFVSIRFHPWILAEEKERMQHWEEWLQSAIGLGLKIGPLSDVLPPEQPKREPGSN